MSVNTEWGCLVNKAKMMSPIIRRTGSVVEHWKSPFSPTNDDFLESGTGSDRERRKVWTMLRRKRNLFATAIWASGSFPGKFQALDGAKEDLPHPQKSTHQADGCSRDSSEDMDSQCISAEMSISSTCSDDISVISETSSVEVIDIEGLDEEEDLVP
uniref:Uncharacterized protein n=1 Tax=Compsopogon caeruleus TaxID=31354 RepID=A0A7S1XD64_9RHOD|mmetsp:Transcript_13795/g.28322  ORF Transcript_13795/g.28322 Transcript_13795/m.28322 type:complete len:157 (+) Transcript_13795:111-581(+)